MNTIEFLNQLHGRGIQLWLDAGKLRFRAPNESFTEELREELTRRKPEIIALLRQRQAVGDLRIERAPRDVPIPLTFAQQRLWFLDQFQPGVPAYNVCDANIIEGVVDLGALRRAANELVRRHELLRTRFPSIGGIPVQRIEEAGPFIVDFVDLTELPAQEREIEAYRLADEEARTPFDLANGPLLRIGLIKLDNARHMWLLSIHHIVSDDWSKKLISRELEVLYESFSNDRPSPLPELSIQWADFAVWQHKWLSGENLQAHVDYWKEALAGELPTLNLPADRPRKTQVHGKKGRFFFPPSLTRALRALCEAEGVTLFMAVLAGYACLLAHYTRQDDIIIGSPISDRSNVETEGLIGFMLNTLPLRVRVDRRKSFRDLLQQVKDTCLGAYGFQSVPYESLMQELAVERDATGNPLFRSVLTLLNTPDVGHEAQSLWKQDDLPVDLTTFAGNVGPYEPDYGNGTTMFDFSMTLTEKFGEIWGKSEHNADIFDESSVSGIIERFQLLLSSAALRPEERIGKLCLQEHTQLSQVRDVWSRGPDLSCDMQRLNEFVERQALLRPDAVAIEHDGRVMSYGQLNARANQVARHLLGCSVTAESAVGVYFERSIELFVVIIAILKAGACYVPLDIAFPIERLAFILDDANASILVTTEDLGSALPLPAHIQVRMDVDAAAIASYPDGDLQPSTGPDGLACILYTSGSTGRPKGVGLTHQAQVSYIEDTANAYGIDASDRILQFASIAFDASLEESYLAFARGAALVLRGERMLDSVDGFVAHCRSMRLSTLVLPTVYWHELVASMETVSLPPDVRRVVIGGERALPEKIAMWQRKVSGRVDLYNTYGPTEGTISVTRYKLPASGSSESSGAEVPIGQPNANTTVYVLDPDLQPVPWGIPGEVFIGGVAVARGYVGKPALTADRFIPDPFSQVPGARLYRTGDLARFLPDGNLQYRGRIDAQVKIRGYRIEPREVELVMQAHPDLKDVAVVVREDEPGERRLVAYVVARPGSQLDTASLRAFLQPKLPSYMIPAAFLVVTALPVNASGKLDVRALPAPEEGNVLSNADHVSPRTPTEDKLCEIWSLVLKRDRVGISENFFDLGGHSLLATRVVARVNDAFRVDLPLRRLFEGPTVAELATILDGIQTTVGQGRVRLTSVGDLLDAIDTATDDETTGSSQADMEQEMERVLSGLEHMTDDEVSALLEVENDPGLDQ